MICIDCKAEIVSGPVHRSKCTYYSKDGCTIKIDVRCEECARHFGMACWNEEEQGAYPLMPPTLPGRA